MLLSICLLGLVEMFAAFKSSVFYALLLCSAFFICAEIALRGGKAMVDYKKLYFELFNALTDILEKIKEFQKTSEEAHIEAEK